MTKLKILGSAMMTILCKVHASPYVMHLRGNKMYRDLNELYRWPGLKREQVKAEHEFPFDLLQSIKIP
ncbi:NBS-LRR resistance-like protein [Gossypium australe]|uniref:NBS-LRR resistance-like protein n=1 Tax=Gossypium australe TaxID=47621 RepID=A0A5B6UUG5_9ROSI|nr:NBS-LRR resistance-like protein [Gossypium australe]